MPRLLALFCCIVICASVPGAQNVLAQQADIERPLILVANPDLKTPLYRESVILVAPHLVNGSMGHIGVMLNRPTTASMTSLFPDDESSKNVLEPVFYGGPYRRHAITALVPAKDAPDQKAVFVAPGLYLTPFAETIDAVIKSAPNSARYYAGITVWLPRELESELRRGLWFTTETKDETIFSKDAAGLWDKLIQPLLQKRDAI